MIALSVTHTSPPGSLSAQQTSLQCEGTCQGTPMLCSVSPKFLECGSGQCLSDCLMRSSMWTLQNTTSRLVCSSSTVSCDTSGSLLEGWCRNFVPYATITNGNSLPTCVGALSACMTSPSCLPPFPLLASALGTTAKEAEVSFLSPSDLILPSSLNSPTAEGARNLIDNVLTTSYTNNDGVETSVIIVPRAGYGIFSSFAYTTGQGNSSWDPKAFVLEGAMTVPSNTTRNVEFLPIFSWTNTLTGLARSKEYEFSSLRFRDNVPYNVFRLRITSTYATRPGQPVSLSAIALRVLGCPIADMQLPAGSSTTCTATVPLGRTCPISCPSECVCMCMCEFVCVCVYVYV
jgi:hypothetical protein